MADGAFQKSIINVEEPFPHLPRAPIVEAVIDVQARATISWEEATVRPFVERKLAGYRFLDFQREFQHEFKLEPGKSADQVLRDLGLKGVRFRSSDEKHIAQFNRDGLILSRLEPYENWAQLVAEGQRGWSVFRELALPAEINRIGLRFINRIKLPSGDLVFDKYIKPSPEHPVGLDLPFYGFMHQDTLAVPETPYVVRVIRTIQPPAGLPGSGAALILDIDVFTVPGFSPSEDDLVNYLSEMRWLKNKAFFGSVTETALETFR